MNLLKKFLKFCCFLSCCCNIPPKDDNGTEYEMKKNEEQDSSKVRIREKYASCPDLMKSDRQNWIGEMKKWKSQNFTRRKRLRKPKKWKPIPHRRPSPFIDAYKSPREGTPQELITYLDYLATFCRPLEADNKYTQAFELDWIMGYERFEWAARHIYKNTYAEGDY